MQQYTPPVVGVRSAMTCYPLQKCRSGRVANINIYYITVYIAQSGATKGVASAQINW